MSNREEGQKGGREGGAESLGDDAVREQGSGRRCGTGLGLQVPGPQFGHRWSDHFQEASAAPDGKRYPSCRLTPINKLELLGDSPEVLTQTKVPLRSLPEH